MLRKRYETEGCLFIRTIPRNLKDHWKSWCVKRNLTMTQAIVQYMKQCINSSKVEDASNERSRN